MDLELTPELIEAGVVREIIRAVQEERKQSGFDISDRIQIEWNGNKSFIAAFAHAESTIHGEVLAISSSRNEALAFDPEIGLALALSKRA